MSNRKVEKTDEVVENILTENDQDKAKYHSRKSGEALKPPGGELLGVASLYFYQNKFSSEKSPIFHVGTHMDLGKVPEEFADMGFKELRKRMMESYGRK